MTSSLNYYQCVSQEILYSLALLYIYLYIQYLVDIVVSFLLQILLHLFFPGSGPVRLQSCWKIYRIVILSVTLYVFETWSLKLRENVDWGYGGQDTRQYIVSRYVSPYSVSKYTRSFLDWTLALFAT
jgi:hypothetical protein